MLLHSCCAPCSGAILECMVQNGIRPTVFFSNSNISPKEEYDLREAELLRYAASLEIDVVSDEYDHDKWLEAVKGLENEPERGSRCEKCFRYRLSRAAEYAASNGFSVLATTLASSRWKDLGQVNACGVQSCESTAGEVLFWEGNWRKGGLQPRRDEIIREQGFYNQNFCGCEFSKTVK